jgi:hypothetical protein
MRVAARAIGSAAVVAISLGACAPAITAHSRCVKTERGSAVAQFKREHPCPAGPDAGSTPRCTGHHVHHIVPLMCGVSALVSSPRCFSPRVVPPR